MRNNIIILSVLIFNFSYSQIYEVGFTIGKSNFIGDVGNTTFINPEYNAYGGVIKWNRSPRHAFRFSFLKTKLEANDLDSSDPRRIERGYKFKTPLSELSFGMEFNFFDYDLHDYDILFTPYLYTGIIYSNFNEQLLLNNIISNSSKKISTLGIPIVIGLKQRILYNFILSFEAGARYTFTDKIDGNSYNSNGIIYNFGNINNNDWYMFLNLNLTYTFGQKPCYCNID